MSDTLSHQQPLNLDAFAYEGLPAGMQRETGGAFFELANHIAMNLPICSPRRAAFDALLKARSLALDCWPKDPLVADAVSSELTADAPSELP